MVICHGFYFENAENAGNGENDEEKGSAEIFGMRAGVCDAF